MKELKSDNKTYFKAFIRVVKSLSNNGFGNETVIRESAILATDKEEVKQILLNKYPQFFPENKIYFKETKDQAQFFYIQVFPLYNYELELLNEGEWVCNQCNQVHENKIIERPYKSDRLFAGKLFCGEDCYKEFKVGFYNDVELPDDVNYINSGSPNYIYKVTEKATNKVYIGKTRNAPFFRWWNHLTHSSSPFGLYLRSTSLSEWTFEVLEVLPSEINNTDVLRIESDYIRKFDSINNGYNSVISHKKQSELQTLFNQVDI